MTDTISNSLLERVQQHDATAWQKMVELFSPLVARWAMRGGLSEHDAADLVQDVFTGVFRGIAQFQRDATTGTFRGWLYRITHYKIRDHYRNLAKNPTAEGGSTAHLQLQEVADPVPEFTETQDNEVTEHLVRRGLELIRAEFEPRTWRAFEALTAERPAAEVATELGMSLGAVYVAKCRVFKRLRDELAGLI